MTMNFYNEHTISQSLSLHKQNITNNDNELL